MNPSAVPSAPFLAAFRRALEENGTSGLRFDQFVELALYHPTCGYYTAPRRRVGRTRGTDFFTATSSGPWFGELVAAACVSLLGDLSPSSYRFVEVGTEPGESVLTGVDHPFAGVDSRRLGDSLSLHGDCILFSNELFDAQPFRRFVARRGAWVELGVRLEQDHLLECEWGPAEEPWLPRAPADGYHFDAPRAAVRLARTLLQGSWRGLLVAFDYGKSYRELAEATPAGTARAYWNHTQSNDLLTRPGEQDLTVHVCWDWLSEEAERSGFKSIALDSQERFFMRHASHYLQKVLRDDGSHRSPRKQAIQHLLHPAYMGQKFQALTAARG